MKLPGEWRDNLVLNARLDDIKTPNITNDHKEIKPNILVYIGVRSGQILRISNIASNKEEIIYWNSEQEDIRETTIVHTCESIEQLDAFQDSTPVVFFDEMNSRVESAMRGPVTKWYRVKLRNGEVYESWH